MRGEMRRSKGVKFPFHHACIVPSLQYQRKLRSVEKIKSNEQKREYWFPCGDCYEFYDSTGQQFFINSKQLDSKQSVLQ